MINSSKAADSPRIYKNSLQDNLSETTSGIFKSFVQPTVTSTPLRQESIFATPPKRYLLSPRRYSLSEITPPRINKRGPIRINLHRNTSGPLLASTKYNVNISTYEDTKSPGLAGRIVKYNEETQREREWQRPPTHQAKYSGPGLFPIVHLFKKKLPPLEPKPRRVTIRIATPEYSRQHTQEYNRKLLEGMIKPSSLNSRHVFLQSNGETSSSTRSVLDALKEISRKRIHANVEYELGGDTGKRIRTEQTNGGDSNKRHRETSPLLDGTISPTKQVSKKKCMYDEYAASCSSMDFSFKKVNLSNSKRKSISISTSTDNPEGSKQVKLVNVETQTIVQEVDKTKDTENTVEIMQNKNQTDEKTVRKRQDPIKVFDNAPLERIRKNRLAALMGSLAGKDPILAPKPDRTSKLNSSATDAMEVPKTTEKALVSILSTNKSPHKTDKHVHFSIPESTSQTNTSSVSVTSFAITQTTTALVTPITSVTSDASEAKVTFETSVNQAILETPAPPSSPVGLNASSAVTATTESVITFGVESNSSSTTSVLSKESSFSILSTGDSKNNIPGSTLSFGLNKISSASTDLGNFLFASTSSESIPIIHQTSSVAPSTKDASPKMGGFKFDLSKSASFNATSTSSVNTKVTASSMPTFSFGISTQKNDVNISNSPLIGISNSTNTPTTSVQFGGFSFGSKNISSVSSSSSPNASSNFTATTTAPTFSLPVTSSSVPSAFKFGSSNIDSSKSGLPDFGLKTANSFGPVVTTSAPSFGVNTSTPAFSSTKTAVFSFGSSSVPPKSDGQLSTDLVMLGIPSSLASSGFGVTNTPASTSSSVSSTFSNSPFGSAAAPIFGTTKSVSPFGVNSEHISTFGNTTTTNSSFGKTHNIPTFGQNTTQSSFGTPTTTASFGSGNTFGTPTTISTSSIFGSVVTTSPAPSLFSATTTSTAVFGTTSSPSVFVPKTSGFGNSAGNPNMFGGTINTQSSGFGTTSTNPLFGTATSLPFGSTTVTTSASFGSGNAPVFNFGAKSPSFRSNTFGITTTVSAPFGTSTAPAFGSSNSFGNTNNFGTANAFGNTNTPTFGISTSSQGFGTTNTPSFGGNNGGFGKNSVFGNSATPNFGANPAPFGASTSNSGFGATSNTLTFGTSSAISAFAKPSTTHNSFGPTTNNAFGAIQSQTNPGFGSTNSTTTQNSMFNFGSGAASKPGVFSFGAASSADVPKPSFNFSAGNVVTPSFGNSGVTSFGNTGTPAFGATGTSQFNPPQSGTAGMFSIGAGPPTTGRARMQIKPKRRT